MAGKAVVVAEALELEVVLDAVVKRWPEREGAALLLVKLSLQPR